ncbi:MULTISPECIES: hypothetical protein [unclassified Pseudoalteromonas]|jgi:hypothetical protein|uniref:hypothetical protein n=1 Tax=unclassified Pseudoalteromonas TaxID=194690 RepID=UPI003868AE99
MKLKILITVSALIFSKDSFSADLYFNVGKATPYLSICSLKNDLYESGTVVDFTNEVLSKIYHASDEPKKKIVAEGADEFLLQLEYQSALGVTKEDELYSLPRCERHAVTVLKQMCSDKTSEFIPSKPTCEKAKQYFK